MEKIVRAPYTSPWGDVQQHIRLSNGAFEVQTARHGGVMIDATLARQMLSKEALEIGFIENGFYCFEEDADAQVPLKELYENGLLNKEVYFSHFVPRNSETRSELETRWKGLIDDDVETFHPDYFYKDAVGASFKYSVVDDKAIIDRYIGSDTDVIIPPEIDGHKVAKIGFRAFQRNGKVRSVVIPDGVTEIGDSAFRCCKSLEIVTIPDSVGYVYNWTFFDCPSLKTVEVSRNTEIPESAFPYDVSVVRREPKHEEKALKPKPTKEPERDLEL